MIAQQFDFTGNSSEGTEYLLIFVTEEDFLWNQRVSENSFLGAISGLGVPSVSTLLIL